MGGVIQELPLRYMEIFPFTVDHEIRTGEFARIVFQHKGRLLLRERTIIPNDSKLFAQADVENSIAYYLSSDTESIKIYNALKEHDQPKFTFIDLRAPYSGIFDF